MYVQSDVKTLEKDTTANTHAEVCQKIQGLNLLPLKTTDRDFDSERRAQVACVNVFCARAGACTGSSSSGRRADGFSVGSLHVSKLGSFPADILASSLSSGSWLEAKGQELPIKQEVEEGRGNLTLGITARSHHAGYWKGGEKRAREMSHFLIFKHL